MKWLIIFITSFWCIFAAMKASEIGPLTEPEVMIDIDHPL